MENYNQIRPAGFLEKNRNIIKGFLIGFLILLMLIPAAFIHNLVDERKQRQQEVINEVSDKWASAQTVNGPVLLVPYKTYETLKDGKVIEHRQNAYLLPSQLKIVSNVQPEVRHRSLYNVTLYRSAISINGQFDTQPLTLLKLDPDAILWDESRLILGLDDARGLEEEVKLSWNGHARTLESGVPENQVVKTGLSTSVPFDTQKTNGFVIQLKLRGSEQLYFTPVGKITDVTINSPWKDPAFDGQYLPVKTTPINNHGFSANWKVLQVSRNYPQVWTNGTYDLRASAFGVRLIQPADNYAKTERSVKYALLFIALTFTVFFFIEIIQKRQIHPLQYLMVGFALCVFYTLLLSISEYTGFNPAYIISGIATVLLIGIYVWSLFKKTKIAIGFTTALAGLYTYIFVLIQLQDYALLFGSIGLFIILSVLMYWSRKIDWYDTAKSKS